MLRKMPETLLSKLAGSCGFHPSTGRPTSIECDRPAEFVEDADAALQHDPEGSNEPRFIFFANVVDQEAVHRSRYMRTFFLLLCLCPFWAILQRRQARIPRRTGVC